MNYKAKKTDGGAWVNGKSYEYVNEENVYVAGERVLAESVCQAIGLFDAEGKPVYEGDILKTNTTNMELEVVIVWAQDEAKYQADRLIGGKFSNLTAAKVAHWRVVGNIHNRENK